VYFFRISNTTLKFAKRNPTGSSWEADLRMLSLVLYCVIFVVGTLGNGLVIYVTGFKMKRTVNSVWFLNLALADFLFTTFLIFPIISVSQEHRWIVGRVMCKLNTFVTVVNLFASVLILLAISVDRCLATRVVVWAQNKRTVPKAKVLCLVIWIIAMSCSVPYATFRDIIEHENITYCVYSKQRTNEIHVILTLFRFTVGFLIPFVGISVSYVAIYCRARSLQKKRQGRSRRIIIAVILAFLLCWLPFHIFELLGLFSKNEQHQATVRAGGPVVVSLAFLNSCLNPILYVFMCDDFQKKLKQSICHVLESALAEEHMSFMSSRSLSAHFSKITRRSESAAPDDNKGTSSSLCPDDKGVLHFEATDTNDYPNKE
uniref:Si:dkey-117a8.4 n=1 Tax=Neogobius melanostomus TaxID=47308 RepID=A0A8C6SKB7_9GOBI